MAFREIDDDLWEIVQKYLPPTKPHIGRPRCDPRRLINGILYVLTTECSWIDVPANYGTKSTVHRYHLELCEKDVYQAIFLDLLRSGYEIKKKKSISHIVRRIPRISKQKRGIDRL
jgi:transposase